MARRLFEATALLLLSCALAIGVAELVLRQVLPRGYMIYQPATSYSFVPVSEIMPGVSGESRFRTNRWGVRADELLPTHRHRILAIGGSTTECLYLDQTEMWTQLLQDALDRRDGPGSTWVGNAGMSARNSRHHLLALQHLPLDEMSIGVVVVLAGVNDLSIRLSQGEAFNPAALDDGPTRAGLMEETFRGLTYGRAHDSALKRTAIWQALRRAKAAWSRDDRGPGAQDAGGTIFETWRRHRRAASELRLQLPDLSAAIEEYTRNLRSMHATAKARGLRLIFMTQPTLWRANLPQTLENLLWFGGVGDFQRLSGQPYYSAAALRGGLQRYNQAMLDVCRTEAIECIDLAAIDEDTSLFYDDVHFNEAGARAVAGVMARHFAAAPPSLPGGDRSTSRP